MNSNKITRRNFAMQLAAASAAVSLGSSALQCSGGKKQTPVAIQLYTVRDLMKNDFKGTVEKVAKIGYDAVEFAGYGGLSAKEVKQLLKNTGLQIAGTHEGFESLQANTEERIAFNLGIGNKNIVVPSMPGKWRESNADGIKEFAAEMNKLGAKVNDAGMQLLYHNHNFEFTKLDGETIYEILLKNTDANLLKLEIDVAWVQRGGQNPANLIRKEGSRVVSLHMKDFLDDANYTFVPVGTGVVDFKGIIKAARKVGVQWFIVEQDRIKRPVLEAIEISLKNMRKLLKQA